MRGFPVNFGDCTRTLHRKTTLKPQKTPAEIITHSIDTAAKKPMATAQHRTFASDAYVFAIELVQRATNATIVPV